MPKDPVASLKRLSRRPREIWQGGFVRLPAWVNGPGGAPYRPVVPLWISLGSGLLQSADPVPPSERDPRALLETFAKFATNDQLAGYLPEKVEVIGPDVASMLKAELAPLGIEVEEREALRALDRFIEEFQRHKSGVEPAPGALDVPGVTPARIAAFAEAARLFYEAAPWKWLSNNDLIRIEKPRGPAEFGHALVMGAGGQEFGVMFFQSASFLETISGDADGSGAVAREPCVTVSFGGIDEMPLADSELFEDGRIPVAGSKAYPWAAVMGPKRRIRRLNARSLELTEGILRALAATKEAEIDSGRWTRVVPTHDGRMEVTLALPELVDHQGEPSHPRRPIADRRVTERVTVEMERYFERNPPANERELHKIIGEKFSGRPLDEIPSTASTPFELAQDLCFQAFEARGRKRVHFARRALEVFPDCSDAFVILAEQSGDREECLRLYRDGVAAGERVLGPSRFAPDAPRFWGDLSTRPYMRSLQGVADTCALLGRTQEAIDAYERLLELNPNDNQGVRDPLAGLLLTAGQDVRLARLVGRFEDDPGPVMAYAAALLAFRKEGDSRKSCKDLRAAIKLNPHVADVLLDPPDEPAQLPDSYSFGSMEEALICVEHLAPGWSATPGALEWLEKIVERP